MRGQTGRTSRDKGKTKGAAVVGARSGAAPLDLEVRRVVGSSCCHQFHWRSGGRRVFVSVQQNNNNALHTNPNCKIVQDITHSMYDMIVLQHTAKVTYNENVSRKNTQKTAEI